MRDMTVAALRELGFAVLPAASAADALQILKDRPEIGLLFIHRYRDARYERKGVWRKRRLKCVHP